MVVHELTYQPKKILANMRIEGNRTLSVGPQQLLVGRDDSASSRWSCAGAVPGRAAQHRSAPPAAARTSRPASSLPTTETKDAVTPNARRLRRTLPAPPNVFISRSTHSTGIGASGDTRVTSPRGVMIQHHVADAQDACRSQAVDMGRDRCCWPSTLHACMKNCAVFAALPAFLAARRSMRLRVRLLTSDGAQQQVKRARVRHPAAAPARPLVCRRRSPASSSHRGTASLRIPGPVGPKPRPVMTRTQRRPASREL